MTAQQWASKAPYALAMPTGLPEFPGFFFGSHSIELSTGPILLPEPPLGSSLSCVLAQPSFLQLALDLRTGGDRGRGLRGCNRQFPTVERSLPSKLRTRCDALGSHPEPRDNPILGPLSYPVSQCREVGFLILAFHFTPTPLGCLWVLDGLPSRFTQRLNLTTHITISLFLLSPVSGLRPVSIGCPPRTGNPPSMSQPPPPTSSWVDAGAGFPEAQNAMGKLPKVPREALVLPHLDPRGRRGRCAPGSGWRSPR